MLGRKAPKFALRDQNGKKQRLIDYSGKKVLLFFYPKDNTPGCTVETCSFRDNLNTLKSLGITVLGISADSIESHNKFIEKENLNFLLLSDESKKTLKKYHVWVEKNMYGKKYMGIARESFLIDKEGIIIKHYQKVNPLFHVAQIISDIKRLSEEEKL